MRFAVWASRASRHGRFQLVGGPGGGDITGGIEFVVEVRMFAFEPCFTFR